MRILTILFATLFLVGCPENDSATNQDAEVTVTEDAANAAETNVDGGEVTPASDAASDAAGNPEDASNGDATEE